MKLKLVGAIALSVAMAMPASAADTATLGQSEYRNSCAACHGADGRGTGAIAEFLKQRVPDLTMLAKQNNGVFPFERVYQTVDGRKDVLAHGTREMPVWGSRFKMQASEVQANEMLSKRDIDSITRARILALIEYIYSMQSK